MYIKPKIREENVRIDIEALHSRSHNPSMQDMYINKARKTLETLFYRNERATKFEVFNRKLQNSVNILDSYGRTKHNKDVVNLLWKKFNNSELAMFVASIKVDYCHNCQKYTNILQEIYIQIPTEKTPLLTTAGVSELKTGGNNNRNTSVCPV